MPAFIARALLAAALVSAGPVFAQAPPAGPETKVVVTGAPDREQEIRDFVAALTRTPSGQLADYAIMRTLARTDPHQLPASSPATILKVLEAPADSEVPTTLTRG